MRTRMALVPLLLFLMSMRAYAGDLLQSIGPDVALLPSLSALSFTSPADPSILAVKARVGVPTNDPTTSDSVPYLAGTYSPACPNDGVINASACLQAAVNAARNILIPHGTYLVTRAIHVPTGRNILCADNLTSIHNPRIEGGLEASTFIFDNVDSGSLSNCLLQGSNDPLQPTYSRAMEFITMVLIRNRSSSVTIDNNRFQGCQGDACIEVYGAPGIQPNHDIRISGNTCIGSGLYCIALVSSLHTQVIKNWATDASIGAGADVSVGQINALNIFDDNTVQRVNGAGDKVLNPNVFLTGGTAAGADYSTNFVRNTTLLGGAVLVKDADTGAKMAHYQ
jgi:hypothetical protein